MSNKPGPSKKYPEQVVVRVSNELHEKVQEKKAESDRTVSDVLRSALEDWTSDVTLEPDPDQVNAFEVDKKKPSPFDNDFQREGSS